MRVAWTHGQLSPCPKVPNLDAITVLMALLGAIIQQKRPW